MNFDALACLALTSFCATAATGVQAACSANSASQRSHLVELYTSEGCDSCPPAERWLSKMPEQSGLIALEFHVDYWDSPQWHDPYADERFTARQKELVRRSGSKAQVYTPQIVVDGHIWSGWPKGKPPLSTATNGPELALQVEPGRPLRARVDATAATTKDDYHLFVALTESGLANAVTGGENRGATLENDHVVRAFAGPLPLGHADVVLDAPVGIDLARASVVAFAQSDRNGDVTQVAHVLLATCPELR